LEIAHGALPGQRLRLVREDPGQVHVDPREPRGQGHAPGARVEPGGEVDDRVGPVARDGAQDELVEDARAHDHRPEARLEPRQRARDRLAPLAGQAPGVRILEMGVRPLGLEGPVERDPAGRVAHVLDAGIGHCGSKAIEV